VTKVAVVGLGAMGSRLARRLLDAGHDLTVWNRTAAKAKAFGAPVAASPAEAASSADVVITMVADPAALRDVTEGPDGVAAGARTATVIDMSTVGPAAVERLASVLDTDLLDAPVLGSLSEAEEGRLSIFVGGEEHVFERWLELLGVLGTPHYVGPQGSGAAAKLVANSTLFGVIGVIGEALALADSLRLTREAAFRVLSTTALANQAERRRPAVESGDYPPRFPLRLARKDADLIAALGLDLRLAEAAPILAGRDRKPRPRLLGRARDDSRTGYSTVTVFAKLRGWSTLRPRRRAIRYASSCSGTTASTAWRKAGLRGM
jgi:3-hydroxyisobutyrate dehydrogenase-like beta-hydroxyacid dehydrogenase